MQIMSDFYEAAHKTGNPPEALAEVQRKWLQKLRTEKGLAQAVNLAGPFIMSSQGKREGVPGLAKRHLDKLPCRFSCLCWNLTRAGDSGESAKKSGVECHKRGKSATVPFNRLILEVFYAQYGRGARPSRSLACGRFPFVFPTGGRSSANRSLRAGFFQFYSVIDSSAFFGNRAGSSPPGAGCTPSPQPCPKKCCGVARTARFEHFRNCTLLRQLVAFQKRFRRLELPLAEIRPENASNAGMLQSGMSRPAKYQ